MNNGRPGVVGGPSGVYRKLHPAPANVIQNDFNPAAAAAATTVKISSAAAGQDLSAGVTGSDGSTWSILPPPPPQQQNGRIVVLEVQEFQDSLLRYVFFTNLFQLLNTRLWLRQPLTLGRLLRAPSVVDLQLFQLLPQWLQLSNRCVRPIVKIFPKS